jgi:lipid A ethanolaminephosphotransferase
MPSTVFNWIFLGTIVYLVFCTILIALIALYVFGASKIGCVIFYIVASILSFFSYNFGIIFDETVTKSTLETTVGEFSQYLNLNLLLWIVFNIFIALLFMFKVELQKVSFANRMVKAFKVYAGICLSLFIIGSVYYKDYASFLRNNRQFRHMVNPISPIYETGKYFKKRMFPVKNIFVQIGGDARMITESTSNKKLVILILGETARSDHFSINGYKGNETTPNLQKLDVVSLKKVVSCGTATAVSVPCMLSRMGQQAFSIDGSKAQSNLLDVAKLSGYEVSWIDNNTGCQGVCDRVNVVDLNPYKNDKDCTSTTCYDEILVSALKDQLRPEKNQLIVLHTLGSHGPSYYLRYPKAFAKFKPSCETSELSNCTKEEVINTYDNSLLYTDYIVSKIINYVDETDSREKTVVYISDHGESLGENGVYLHSLPYVIAPKEQKHVPFIFWFDQKTAEKNRKKIDNLRKFQLCNFSHDNIFSTFLDILDISTILYEKKSDLLRLDSWRCKVDHG